ELEPVGVRRLDGDRLRRRAGGHDFDSGCSGREGIRDDNGRFLADDLQHRPARHDEAAVKVADNSIRERQRSREDDIDAAWPNYLLAPSALRLARDQAEAANAVTADHHPRPRLKGGAEAS